MGDSGPTTEDVVERLADAARACGLTVAVAESLTGGQLSAALAAGPEASAWFRGGIVAYSPEVKFRMLGVERGPVVTRACAEQMAKGVAELTGARVSVAVTGVGGPDPEEGEPAGTVWMARCVDGASRADRFRFPGEPAAVLAATVERALAVLLDEARSLQAAEAQDQPDAGEGRS